ncbi:hypothetical protein K1T71_008637 [Dendrolimus kikuchii]|uniref:Uncharacterized protein n=1 Tax=Dendrolimus kikuchii TaxID=765133 RepID=A0ACC1CV17_9NEOP|nr:hypothetical protein K1T71_008637 [Dendrolimus kikuchii]
MGLVLTAGCGLLAFLLYYNTLDAGFVYDDRRAILSNPDVAGHTPFGALFNHDFWGTSLTDAGSHGSFRPLCVATYRLNHSINGFKPWGYHFVNVILHCISTILVVITARRLLPRNYVKVGATVAGLTFAAHPIHTEAVAGVVGRADVIACNLFLVSFLCYTEHIRLREETFRWQCENFGIFRPGRNGNGGIKPCYSTRLRGVAKHVCFSILSVLMIRNYEPVTVITTDVKTGKSKLIVSPLSACVLEDAGKLLQWLALFGTVLFAIAATLCKEPGIMVLPLCIIYDLLKGSHYNISYFRRRWASVFSLGACGLLLLTWRLYLTGPPGSFALADNPTARDPSIFTRLFTFLYLPVFNFYLLLYPFQLSFDWSMESIPRIRSLADKRNLATILFYVLLMRFLWCTLKNVYMKPHKNCAKSLRASKKSSSKIKAKPFKDTKHKTQGKTFIGHAKDYVSSKKRLCPCIGCNHPLIDDHMNTYRDSNNNNMMMHNSICVCTLPYSSTEMHNFCRTVHCSPQVAMLVFTAFMIFPFIPATNILFYVGFVVAERVLYIPSVGFCLLLGLGASILTKNWHCSKTQCRIFMLVFVSTLSAMSKHTMNRNLDWHDEESLFRSAVHVNPPKAYGNLGSILISQGRNEEAEFAFEQALKYRPNMADVHYNLGILRQNQRRYSEAAHNFKTAINLRPSMALAYANLGASLLADGRTSAASRALKMGSKVDGDNVRNRREHEAARVSSLVQLATLQIQQGDLRKALITYKEAIQLLPIGDLGVLGWTRSSVLLKAVDLYMKLGDWPLAEKTVFSALDLAPDHLGAQLTLAEIISRNTSRGHEAAKIYNRVLSKYPNDPTVREHYGMHLLTQNRLLESAKQYLLAAQLAPRDAARAAAAARSLRNAGKCRIAEKWYTRAVILNPRNAEYHSNLGAIYHLNGKYTEAAASYRKSLALNPNDEIVITNLNRVRSVIYTERRKQDAVMKYTKIEV